MEGNIELIKETVEGIDGVDQPTYNEPGVSSNASTQQIACPFYKEGRCRFGDMCLNYHDPNMKPIKNRKFSEKREQKLIFLNKRKCPIRKTKVNRRCEPRLM